MSRHPSGGRSDTPVDADHLRVLIVEQSGGIGGAGLSLEALVADAGKVGRYQFTVALATDGPLVARLDRRAVSVQVVPTQGWRWWFESWFEAAKILPTLPRQIRALDRWIRFIRGISPAIVHLNDSRLLEPLLAARWLRIPVIAHFRNIPGHASVRFPLGMSGFYSLMNRADRWIANSTATAADIAEHARVPVAIVPNGIDLDEFDRRAAEPSQTLKPRPLRVAMIALLNRWKRHDVFLMVAELVLRHRRDVTFSVVGSPSDARLESELKEYCRRAGLADRVEFLGHVENVPAFLRTVDVLVHTTDPEPFGRVFLEAMAAERPVVAFRSGGSAEIVRDGETGYLIESGQIDRMSEILLRLLGDDALRARLGEEGRRRVGQHYSIAHHRAMIACEYDKLLEQCAARGR